jgi:hypothetical protein
MKVPKAQRKRMTLKTKPMVYKTQELFFKGLFLDGFILTRIRLKASNKRRKPVLQHSDLFTERKGGKLKMLF